MMVYLVRHGPAEERDPRRWSDDTKRPLTRKGIRETEAAAAGLAALEPEVEVVVTSPAVRAYATAEIVRKALKVEAALAVWDELAPDEPAVGVLARLRETAPRWTSVALVGHEPALGELIGLAIDGEATSVARLSRGGAAAIGFPRQVVPSAGRLEWLMTRGQLGRFSA